VTQPTREEALAHFGVKGQRWGVVNEEVAAPKKTTPRKATPKKTTASASKAVPKKTAAAKAKTAAKAKATQPEPPPPVEKKGWRPSKKQIGVAIVGAAFIAAAVTAPQTAPYLDSGEARAYITAGKNFLLKQEPGFRKNAALAAKDMSVDDIMSKVVRQINPGYPFPGSTMNCRRCTLAYEMRRRGYDVRSTKTLWGTGQTSAGMDKATTANIGWRSLGRDRVLKKMKNGEISGLDGEVSDIFRTLRQQPERSRGEVGVQWLLRGAHSIAYEIIDGKPILFDTQSGKKITSPEEWDTVYRGLGISRASFTRLDNQGMNYRWLSHWVKNRYASR